VGCRVRPPVTLTPAIGREATNGRGEGDVLPQPDTPRPLTLPRAIIVGLPGAALDAPTGAALRDLDPAGLILFARNIEDPVQLRALTDAIRATLRRNNLPILIDQEGGRVARLRGNHFRHPPAAARFGKLFDLNAREALRAAFLNARLIAQQLADAGITVDCAPVCDIAQPGAHDVIGDRAFHADPAIASALARATARGLLAGGVQPVMKHIPGHGRAQADSHLALPVVDADAETLRATDLVPFKKLRAVAPWAMTAHIRYPALDRENCATLSGKIIQDVIRREVQFHGVLVSDDLRMKALSGDAASLAVAALAAGCDVALDCAPGPDDWPALARAVPRLRPESWRRLRRAARMARRAWRPFDPQAALDSVGAALARV
jgi:beta-N-acetylhexosaminidase